jgi:hypothetical protein
MTVVQDKRTQPDHDGAMSPRSIIPGSVCVVTLVDRRTGSALRVNGSRVVIYTRAPRIAAEELLAGRDASVWDVRIEPLDPVRRRS